MNRRIDKTENEFVSKNNPKGHRKIRKFFIIFLIIILIFTVTILGYGYFTLNNISKSKITPKKVSIKKPVNILLLGVDAGDYTNHTKNNPNRSDTMMLVRFNPITNKVYMLSIPRDTKTLLHGVTEKLNAAHAIGGPEFTISTIEKMLNIDINYYGEINYQGFRECIDAIGGVNIKIPRDMNYDAWKINIHFKKGEVVHMDGEKAEEFVRWRKNNDGGGYAMGDLGRISTQQQFLVELIKKIKTPSGLIRIPSLINTVSKYIETNLSSTEILEYALKIKNLNSQSITKGVLEGQAKYINGVSYFVWNGNQNDKFIENYRGNENTVTSTLTNTNSTNSLDSTISPDNNVAAETVKNANKVNKKNIEVIVLNSTGKQGLALKYKKMLMSYGYRVTQTDNYLYKKYKTSIINDYGRDGYGDIIKNDLGFGTIVTKKRNKPLANLVVILGTDSIK